MIHLPCFIFLMSGLAAATGSAAAAAPMYHLQDLGPHSEAYSANDKGQVAGYVSQQAALYRRGQWKLLRDDGNESQAHGVDLHANVAGMFYSVDGAQWAAYWPRGGHRQVITLPFQHATGTADAISPGGAFVVGVGSDADFEPKCFLWKLQGTAVDMGTLGGDACIPFAVNDAGVVAGLSDVAGGDTHAFLWENGVFQDVGTLKGTSFAKLVALNSAAHAVGEGERDDGSRLAILWDGARLKSIGTLGGRGSTATAINDAGEIVGEAQDAAGTLHAFVYTGGVMYALDTLIDNAQGWDLLEYGPVSIDNKGVITGNGYIQGSSHAYRLVPANP